MNREQYRFYPSGIAVGEHKERLLANIENMQNLLDISLLLGVEDIQRELNCYYPSDKSVGSILEKWIESIKRFFQEL